jgi:N utilization substance protein A
VAELNGEKVDVVLWHDETSRYVAEALSPAEVLNVRTDEEHKIANVIVPERQLSLAIGKEGQNARLAAKLTGWRIDIRSEAGVAQAAAAAVGSGPPEGAMADGESTLDAEDATSSEAFGRMAEAQAETEAPVDAEAKT